MKSVITIDRQKTVQQSLTAYDMHGIGHMQSLLVGVRSTERRSKRKMGILIRNNLNRLDP
jgi:hypothetical protein